MASSVSPVRIVSGITSDWSNLLLLLWFDWAGEGVRAGTEEEKGSQHHGAGAGAVLWEGQGSLLSLPAQLQ